jgi:hypothetical protein
MSVTQSSKVFPKLCGSVDVLESIQKTTAVIRNAAPIKTRGQGQGFFHHRYLYRHSISKLNHFFHFPLRKPPLHRIRAKHIQRRLVQVGKASPSRTYPRGHLLASGV